MQNQNPLFEDVARLMSSVAGTMAGAGREAESRMREKLREAVGGLDMVSREEFEAVKAMAAETRAELEALKASLHAADCATEGKNGGKAGSKAGSKDEGDVSVRGAVIRDN